MTDTAMQQRRAAYTVNVAAAATALGLLAFAADSVDGVAGHVMVALASSGFAWGLAAVMTAVWLAGSLLAGPLLGLLGHAVRANSTRRAALAAGIACGLLSGEGWHAIVQAPPWRLLALGDPFFYGVVFGEIVRVVLPLAVLAWLVAAHRLGRAWSILLAATVAAATAGTLLWYALGLVQGA
ncbi:hypothetical protein ACH4OY_20340 [Micromonospora rubida]|uniref:Uncharacterized protein n=1 Tax=Micromonospora rubida TaxID=2697657 RepID=A0ABW7SQQ6_9ACTN